mgnify:CR=1 FL=1
MKRYTGHSPHGECGLKSYFFAMPESVSPSLPAWGVWIEMDLYRIAFYLCCRHSPHGECGLKLYLAAIPDSVSPSLPAWGVWIEIGHHDIKSILSIVTPRMGSVD